MNLLVYLKSRIKKLIDYATPDNPEPGQPNWIRFVAVLTGTYAALAGYLTVRATFLANEAIFYSNQSLLSQQQASDAWAEYQADSVKARIVETAAISAPQAAIQILQKQAEEFRQRQLILKQKAKAAEAERDSRISYSRYRRVDRDLLNFAGVAVQLGIALASIAAMTKKKQAFISGVVVGIVGISIMAYAHIMGLVR